MGLLSYLLSWHWREGSGSIIQWSGTYQNVTDPGRCFSRKFHEFLTVLRIRIRRIHIFWASWIRILLLYDFLSLKNEVNVPSKSNKQKKNFVDVLNVTDENSRFQDPLVRGMDPQDWFWAVFSADVSAWRVWRRTPSCSPWASPWTPHSTFSPTRSSSAGTLTQQRNYIYKEGTKE